MEAVGAAASIIAVVGLVGRVSASAASFMRDVKDARKDMIQVRKDISDLSTVLSLFAEDLDHDRSPSDDMLPSRQHIVDIAHSCRTVLLEIETVLQEDRNRLGWVTSGKERVDRLRERLETYKLSLDVALDYRTMVVVHDIKEDSSRMAGELSAIQRGMTLLLAKVDNIEQKALEDQESQDGADFSSDGFILNRFLNEYRSDAQTVLDDIDYQQDQDFEDVPPQVHADSSEMGPELNPESTMSSPSLTIRLKNSLGHIHEIPLEQCRTWEQMDEIIKSSYLRDSDERKEVENGRYALYHEGQEISPNSWGNLVGPGLSFDLALWKCDASAIKFNDPLARKYTFPFHSVNTWKGIEGMIKQAFANVTQYHNGHSVRAHVVKGTYDLICADGTIILPVLWEQSIRPNMTITMKMWLFPPISDPNCRETCHPPSIRTVEHQEQHATRPGEPPPKQEQQPPGRRRDVVVSKSSRTHKSNGKRRSMR